MLMSNCSEMVIVIVNSRCHDVEPVPVPRVVQFQLERKCVGKLAKM